MVRWQKIFQQTKDWLFLTKSFPHTMKLEALFGLIWYWKLLELLLLVMNHHQIFLVVRQSFLCFLVLKICIIHRFSLSTFIILCILGHCRKCRKCER